MKLSIPAWGALAGAAVALALLAWAAVTLLNSGGANYKVLVAVWLWALPALGLFAGLGYAAGKLVDVIAAQSRKETHRHANAR